MCIYLFESMVDDGRQVSLRNLWKHLTNSAADVILCPLLCCWTTMQRLPGRVALNLLYHPVLTIARLGLAEAGLFIVFVTELAASKMDDVEGKVVPYAVYMMRKFLGVRVHLVLRFGLCRHQYMTFLWRVDAADRNNMHIQVTLSALLLTPLCDLWVSGRNETKSFGCV